MQICSNFLQSDESAEPLISDSRFGKSESCQKVGADHFKKMAAAFFATEDERCGFECTLDNRQLLL
jgi:hypothetical protein